jgi:hypothetical protein
MDVPTQLVTDLGGGAAYSFATWPNSAVPTFGAGVYTVWHQDGRFIYVGMSGRGMTAEPSGEIPPRHLHTLQSHAVDMKRRSVLCVYVADRSSSQLYLRRTSLLCVRPSRSRSCPLRSRQPQLAL